jgi:molybdopterin molybdotransferase
MELPQVSEIEAAIGSLCCILQVVEPEWLPVADAAGRILAEPILADRDSPAIDVSAMDGYALRLQDVGSKPMAVQETTVAGAPPTTLQPEYAVRIFTGAPVPTGADCVVRREDTCELDDWVQILVPKASLAQGQNIRYRGENCLQASTVLAAGTELTSVAMAAVASFGLPQISVRKNVRVAILNTGDELASAGEPVEPWMIRDSNGPTLDAWLHSLPWLKVVARTRVADTFETVRDTVAKHLADCDAVILTGGVSMGDTDYVPSAIESLGGRIAFHRLPIRPGKPVLGASLGGKLLLGLPGNPVSVAVTSRVFGLPLLSQLAGRTSLTPQPMVELTDADTKQLALTWFRLVAVDPHGGVRLVESQGSGDLVSLARSSGFIAVPAGQTGVGPWRLTPW